MSVTKIYNQLLLHRSVSLGRMFKGLCDEKIVWRVTKEKSKKGGNKMFLCEGYYFGLPLMQCLFIFKDGKLTVEPLQRGVR